MDVDDTQAVGMAEYRDLGVVFYVADELVGAAGDDEVDVLVQRQELIDHVAGFDELDGGIGDLGLGETFGDDGGDGLEGFGGFFAAFEDGGVAGFDG